MPYLTTAFTESNITLREKKETFSGAWEKSAAADPAKPNSKEILMRLRQHFSDAKFLSAPIFCQRLYFCWCPVFVDTNNFVDAYIFVDANIFDFV